MSLTAALVLVSLTALLPQAEIPAPVNNGLQPQRPVYVNSFLAPCESGPAPVELLGLDVSVPGKELADTPIRYQEGRRLNFRFYWIPRQNVTGLSANLTLTGSGPEISQEYALPQGQWEVGAVRRQDVQFFHPRGKYSGHATFSLSVRSSHESQEYTLWKCPVFIETVSFPSKIEDTQLRNAFGDQFKRLYKAFRLGNGAKITLPLTPNLEGNFAGLALISATGFDGSPKRAEAVCRIDADLKTNRFTTELRTALTTAPSEDFRYKPVARPGDPVQVFSSFTRRNITICDYIGFIPFPEPGAPRSLTFEYLDDAGVMDIKEVVLLRHAPL